MCIKSMLNTYVIRNRPESDRSITVKYRVSETIASHASITIGKLPQKPRSYAANPTEVSLSRCFGDLRTAENIVVMNSLDTLAPWGMLGQ